MKTASDALEMLRRGNDRFVAGTSERCLLTVAAQRAALADSQSPFAIVLCCADSRVPAEIVFDQGLGDLFVVRVAGNIVAESQLASIEFAAEQFGTRLVVVLGHTRCGAIEATAEALMHGNAQGSNLAPIVEKIGPVIEGVISGGEIDDRAAFLRTCVRANAHAAADALIASPILGELVRDDGLEVVAAEYDLETGRVSFF